MTPVTLFLYVVITGADRFILEQRLTGRAANLNQISENWKILFSGDCLLSPKTAESMKQEETQ